MIKKWEVTINIFHFEMKLLQASGKNTVNQL